ncbi:heparinase II/III-family protein [Enterococcus sp. OL5]|uniref:heparinase II/III family protein n=1 Tax=Enterococcus sp. OL5 TaxID=2590214 RepID=UPI00167797CD|nr:heparinase II/III-family protein [Enterococcus sp. OL5]
MINKLKRYFYTVKDLKVNQMFYLLTKNKVNFPVEKKLDILREINIKIDILDEDKSYLDRFSHSNKDSVYNVTLLNQDINLLNIFKSDISNYTDLIKFNIHYLEYLIVFGVEFEKTNDSNYYVIFKSVLNDWLDNTSEVNEKLSWHPYVISLQLINILISVEYFQKELVRDLNFNNKLIKRIKEKYLFLLSNTEKHLKGNHYLENLKTIVILSAMFNDTENLSKFKRIYIKELNSQIDEYGFHLELSPMYHKIILEGILRVNKVFESLGFIREKEELEIYIKKMYSMLIYMEEGVKRTPLFNDSGDNIAKSFFSINRYLETKLNFEETIIGQNDFPYFRIENNEEKRYTLIYDASDIGYSYNPGHGHCDSQSFELYCDGNPVFVNSGTYFYQTDKRAYFRSTKAHNTVSINGLEQSDIWGIFRVGKKVKVLDKYLDENSCFSKIKDKNGNIIQRKVNLNKTFISIKETIKINANNYEQLQIVSYLHIHPELNLTMKDGNAFIMKNGKLLFSVESCGEMKEVNRNSSNPITSYSENFGMIECKDVIEIKWKNKKNEIKILFR